MYRILTLSLVFSLPLHVAAQSVDPDSLSNLSPSVPGPYYGTSSETALSINAYPLTTLRSVTTWEWNNGSYLTSTGSAAIPVFLPNGASITGFQADLCDTSSTAGLFAILARAADGASFGIGVTSVNSGNAATPGCTIVSGTLPSPVTVNNSNGSYYIEWANGSAFDGSVKARSFRIFYRLQVSSDPLTASFSDVPTTHPFFRFVEALAAAGITAGCGGGNYCPDAPVTRGEIAVFLAAALGLHWPN
jgi:hypothetical protein